MAFDTRRERRPREREGKQLFIGLGRERKKRGEEGEEGRNFLHISAMQNSRVFLAEAARAWYGSSHKFWKGIKSMLFSMLVPTARLKGSPQVW